MPKILKNQISIKLKPDSITPYASDGDFSTHELIAHLLDEIGPAKVRISSFSITETAIRSFLRLQESGLITSLTCLFDLSVKRYRVGLLFFASNVVSEIGMTNIHAKLVFIENKNWKAVVITSANLNINDKKEAGVIITVPWHYESMLAHYEKWYSESLKVTPDEFN